MKNTHFYLAVFAGTIFMLTIFSVMKDYEMQIERLETLNRSCVNTLYDSSIHDLRKLCGVKK